MIDRLIEVEQMSCNGNECGKAKVMRISRQSSPV
jgi:hypothetical protein